MHQIPKPQRPSRPDQDSDATGAKPTCVRSEEHTSELQSRLHIVCRLLLEKKNIHMTMIELNARHANRDIHVQQAESDLPLLVVAAPDDFIKDIDATYINIIYLNLDTRTDK